MFLTGLTHRRRLYNIAMRWLTDRPRPSDGRDVTEIFVYDGAISIPAARSFMADVYECAFGAGFSWRPIRYKHELREMALEAIGDPTPRQYEMMERYHANPEAFFRRMPIDGSMVVSSEGRLLGGFRIKRPRRVAEKASRRMADHLGGLIRERAEELAGRRARRLGVAMDDLPFSPEDEQNEFLEAESWLSDQFRDGRIRIPTEALDVDDVIGFKIIGDDDELRRAEEFIAGYRTVEIVEREEHSGAYNAVNLLVNLSLPPVDSTLAQYRDADWSFAIGRGMSADLLTRRFPDYLRGGARRIRLELILTSFTEFLESEMGRCIHEYRILQQREARDYRGRMAKNAEFIIEYLLSVAFSPTLDVAEVPVKMWGQYLPETLSYATRELFGQGKIRLVCAGDEHPSEG